MCGGCKLVACHGDCGSLALRWAASRYSPCTRTWFCFASFAWREGDAVEREKSEMVESRASTTGRRVQSESFARVTTREQGTHTIDHKAHAILWVAQGRAHAQPSWWTSNPLVWSPSCAREGMFIGARVSKAACLPGAVIVAGRRALLRGIGKRIAMSARDEA